MAGDGACASHYRYFIHRRRLAVMARYLSLSHAGVE